MTAADVGATCDKEAAGDGARVRSVDCQAPQRQFGISGLIIIKKDSRREETLLILGLQELGIVAAGKGQIIYRNGEVLLLVDERDLPVAIEDPGKGRVDHEAVKVIL